MVGPPAGSPTVILHRDGEQVRAVVQGYGHAGGTDGVFEGVGGRFLDDPVNR